MPQTASVFCNFYIRVDREALVSERALDVGSVAFKAMSTKNNYITFLIYNAKISNNNAESGKVPRMLAAFPR
jgi:hypothetical protein